MHTKMQYSILNKDKYERIDLLKHNSVHEDFKQIYSLILIEIYGLEKLYN